MRTLFLIKPDAILQRLDRVIFYSLRKHGYKILSCKARIVREREVLDLYREHNKKNFFPFLVQYMLSDISYICLCEYKNPQNNIKKLRKLCGATVPRLAKRDSLRGRLSAYSPENTPIIKNFVHTSADENHAKRELKIFFGTTRSFDC
jgi:nucleoside-diphosphate kinase